MLLSVFLKSEINCLMLNFKYLFIKFIIKGEKNLDI